MVQHANSSNVSYYTIVNVFAKEYMLRFKLPLEAFAIIICALTLSLIVHAVPARHVVDIGGYDSVYVQGFFEQQDIPQPFGTDGRARWTGADAALRLPLIGMPSTVTIRVASPITKTIDLLTTSNNTPHTFTHRLRAALDANLDNGIDLVASCQRHNATVSYTHLTLPTKRIV